MERDSDRYARWERIVRGAARSLHDEDLDRLAEELLHKWVDAVRAEERTPPLVAVSPAMPLVEGAQVAPCP